MAEEVPGVAPQAGTVLTSERLSRGLFYLNYGYYPDEEIGKLEDKLQVAVEALEHISLRAPNHLPPGDFYYLMGNDIARVRAALEQIRSGPGITRKDPKC